MGRINVRLVLIFAGFAFIISFTGLLSRVPIGVVFLRAFLFTGIFAIGGAIAGWVFKKYLPELSDIKLREKSEEPKEESVDIVIPEENPHDSQEQDVDEDDVEPSLADGTVPEEKPRDEPEGPDQPEVQTDTETEPEDVIGLEEVGDDLSDLESVPTLDSLQSDFGVSTEDGKDNEEKKDKFSDVDQDPSSAAKAIKKWLKNE